MYYPFKILPVFKKGRGLQLFTFYFRVRNGLNSIYRFHLHVNSPTYEFRLKTSLDFRIIKIKMKKAFFRYNAPFYTVAHGKHLDQTSGYTFLFVL